MGEESLLIGHTITLDNVSFSPNVRFSPALERCRGALWFGSNEKLSNKQKLDPANIDKVIFNPPATIVVFKDGTKEIVKTHQEEFDPEKGFAIAMMNIMFDGNKSALKRLMKVSIEKSGLYEVEV